MKQMGEDGLGGMIIKWRGLNGEWVALVADKITLDDLNK